MDLAPFVAAFVLGTESVTWTWAGNKEAHVRKHLDIGMTAYYQRLNLLIDSELGQQVDPGTCRRLRAIRDARQLSRSVRRSA